MKDRLQKLLERDGARLFALLTRLTLSQDVAHDLFQQLFVNLADSGGFTNARNPSAYAARAAINLAFAWRRDRRPINALDAEPLDPSMEPLDRVIDVEQAGLMLAAMQDLSELVREAIVLRFIEDLSYEQSAARMNKTAHQVRALCHAGVRQLRVRLGAKPTPDAKPLRQVRHE